MAATDSAPEGGSGEAGQLWTRLRCGRGHLTEHPGGVALRDFSDCWCGGPRLAVTVYRLRAC